jgi:hypothetical protein
MATVQTQHVGEERWRENYKDDGSSTRMNRLEINENGPYENQEHTEKQKYNNMNKYPQVRKTGVDAEHEKLPTDGLYHERIVICNM